MVKKLTRTECVISGGTWELKDGSRRRRHGECNTEEKELDISYMNIDDALNDFFINHFLYLKTEEKLKSLQMKELLKSYNKLQLRKELMNSEVSKEVFDKYLDYVFNFVEEMSRLKGCVQCSKASTTKINELIGKIEDISDIGYVFIKSKRTKDLVEMLYAGVLLKDEIAKTVKITV